MGSEGDDVQIVDSDQPLLDIKEINDLEYDIPHVTPPSLESVLWNMESEEESDNASLHSLQSLSVKHRSILSHCILQGVTTQLSSAVERVHAGLPTVITNSKKYITIGTSHGYILSFDSEQNLCWYCYDVGSIDQGAISALAFNLESTRLLIGYERGFVSMVDATNGNIIRKLPDAHAPQTAVLHLRFTFLNNLALCGDSSGCVFSLIFNRRLGVRTWDSKCLFSGARGEVCLFEPLTQGYDINFLNNHVLVAMATLSKVIVISVHPRLKVHYCQQLPKISTSLPMISWQLVSIGKSFQPVLAWGRGNELNYTRVITHGFSNNRIKLLPLRKVQLSYTMISLHWLGTRHLAIFDTSENLRLIEVRTQQELEVLEMANAGLSYSSAHFKALAVGGGVSEAFALAGERACYNSLSSRGDQLLVLGTKAVHVVKLRTWSERLLYLSEQGRWAEALNLASDEGANREKFVIILLHKYLENLNQNSVDEESLTAAINCCVKLGKMNVLCNDILDAVSTVPKYQDLYYTLLTDYICNGSLSHVTPGVAQMLVSHLEQKDHQILENVLLSLDITCLDLHQVLKTCKHFNLYNAWIYITTKTLKDYVSPLIEFLLELTPENHKLGNTMLVYVSCCLTGLGYPNGNIPSADILRVKQDILRCLETVHSINVSTNESTYPYLRALLKYNTRECLNVIEIAFTEAEFLGEMGLLQRQRLIQILMQIVQPPDFTESQVINLACFVSRLFVSNNFQVDEDILNTIGQYLANTLRTELSLRDHMEREQAWLDLLNANKLKHLKQKDLLKMSIESKCFRVAQHLYELQHEYSNIISCYIRDPVYKFEVFNYILNYINVKGRCIPEQFLLHFKDLMSINSKKTSEIVIEHFSELIEQFSEMLEDDPNLQYTFLSEIVSGDIKLPSRIAEIYLEQLCLKNKSAVCNYIQLCSCRNEQALNITRKYEVHAATALLLEQGGEWTEAIELLLKHNMIEDGISLCIRGAEHLDPEGALKLWLTLLQCKKDTENYSSRRLLHAAAPHVPPTKLFELVTDAHFADIKALLQGMLRDYTHDVQMLSITLKLLGKDLHYGLAKSLSSNGVGTLISNIVCGLCQKSLSFKKELNSEQKVVVWSCGHCFHFICVNVSENTVECPQCRLKAEPLPVITKSLISDCYNQTYSDVIHRPDLEGHF